MTDYRDYQTAYDRPRRDRFDGDYIHQRQGGNAGVLIALAVVALLLGGFFVLSGQQTLEPAASSAPVASSMPDAALPKPVTPLAEPQPVPAD